MDELLRIYHSAENISVREANKIKKDILAYINEDYPHHYEAYKEKDYIEDLLQDRIRFIENMSAKEPLNEEMLQNLADMTQEGTACYEEKLDGIRCDLQIDSCYARLFSRRISKKTNWYSENTHNFPVITNHRLPKELNGTVLDGELTAINFKEISSLCNCKWDEAIFRQLLLKEEYGYEVVQYNAFDILYYKGINVMQLPLRRRKELLHTAIHDLHEAGLYNVIEHECNTGNISVLIGREDKERVKENPMMYPYLYEKVLSTDPKLFGFELNALEYFDYIVLFGGEGIMIKPLDAKYYMKRGREFTKVKKFDTWDVIIIGFTEPTKYYEGKGLLDPDYEWEWYCDAEDDSVTHEKMTMEEAHSQGLLPVTKAYAQGWIGTVRYGVVMTHDEFEKWEKINPKEERLVIKLKDDKVILEMGECGGMTDEIRQELTDKQISLINTVMEVGANEQMKKTGSLRHPRFLRLRNDKEWEVCTWKDHLH